MGIFNRSKKDLIFNNEDGGKFAVTIKEFKDLVNKYADGSYYDKRQEDLEKINKFLLDENTNSMEDVFSGEKFEYLIELLGEEWANKFKYIWNNCSNYTYSVGYYRRPFRTKLYTRLYFDKYLSRLMELVKLLKNDFTLESYFNQKAENKYHGLIISNIIAYELDEGNSYVLEKVKDIIYGDNQNGYLTRNIIMGLLMSKKSECYKMVGDLLLAAKLQEGLRQSILESVDETTIEGFKYILNVVLENDLLRFSSVVRSVGVWTGLYLEAEKPSLVKKVIEIIYRCLNDEGYRKECLDSKDTIEIYGALFYAGFIEIKNTKDMIKGLINSNIKYKKLTALYFLSNIQDPMLQYEISKDLLCEDDIETVAWANANITNYSNMSNEEYTYLFNSYKNIIDKIKLEEVFSPSIFPWCKISISKENILDKMLNIAIYSKDDDRLDEISEYIKYMSSWCRVKYVDAISKASTDKQREVLIQLIGDKSDSVRIRAFKESEKLDLREEEYRKMEDYLRFKSGNLRKGIISLLLKQNPDGLYLSIERLLGHKLEEKRLASLDLIYGIKENKDYKNTYDRSLSLINEMKSPSEKVKLIIDKILSNKEEYSKENGFMLYNHDEDFDLPICKIDNSFNESEILDIEEDRVLLIFKNLSDLIHENRDYEYETEYYDGTKKKVILGTGGFFNPLSRKDKNAPLTIDDYPLKDVWVKYFEDYNINLKELLFINFIRRQDEFGKSYNYYRERELKWYVDFKNELYDIKRYKKIYDKIDGLPYVSIIFTILNLFEDMFLKEDIFKYLKNMSIYIYNRIPEDAFKRSIYDKKEGYQRETFILNQSIISVWIDRLNMYIYDDESFKEYFFINYNYYRSSDFKERTMSLSDIKRAYDLGIITENEIYKELMERPESRDKINTITNPKKLEFLEGHHILKEILPKVISRIVEIEVKRGDLHTEVSQLASRINYFEGSNYFVDMILAFGKDSFARGYTYMWNESTKKDMLSHLIKNCHPKENESVKDLKKLLKGKDIEDKKLIDAAMYAPQWISMIEEYLGWKGLSSACWYFHAHVNESFSSLKETMVARYSPITPQEFQDGAFDINWFKDAYKTLGEERFYMVYDSAKYITAGGNHRRAQLFSDAVLSKLNIEDVEDRIVTKRNKDYMLSYGLIPFLNKKKEVLKRYEFIQRFLKESKGFGAQRRESEGKVCAISLDNLSRNAGFENVTRFTWAMEGEKIKELKEFLKPKDVGEFTAYVHVDEEGLAKLKILKKDKELKTIPSILKDNAYIQDLKSVQKDLKDQLSRSKRAFEKAMEDSEEFKVSELNNILLNPVLSPTAKKIVFKCGEDLGYFEKNKLIKPDGSECDLKPSNKIIIAHPVDLYESKVWSDFQRDIFEKKMVQPFKQVFRELYLINEDEKNEGTISRRYAGHQIQPKKTVALLRGRGWTVHYEEGLQRVYYKENIIAEIYALADWFSPSDVEAPTLETIRFYERNSYKLLKLEDIPKKIFSEVMRDVDLVVSVAHVGGVDPEASLSTIEMRAVILEEVLRLIKIDNVRIKGSHAHIIGSLGEYTVHLGSAVCHKMGRGAINILPVHSQHRGRLFLPFIDEDPKTQEVTTKAIFLAEDDKIKDPSILEQIR